MEYQWIIKKDRKYLQFPHLLNAGLLNIFTVADMNFRHMEEDAKAEDRIQKHLSDIFEDFSIQSVQIFMGQQMHTSNIEEIHEKCSGKQNGYARIFDETDGFITDKKDIVLMTKFADCTPVVLFDPVCKVHANIHSGWRGTTKHIALKALWKMEKDYGTNPSNVLVGIGPTLTNGEFEVKKDCLEIFQNSFKDMSNYVRIKEESSANSNIEMSNRFIDKETEKRKEGLLCETIPSLSLEKDGNYIIDLQRLLADELIQNGVLPENIQQINLSTRFDERFHSYRRQGSMHGLMAMLTLLKK